MSNILHTIGNICFWLGGLYFIGYGLYLLKGDAEDRATKAAVNIVIGIIVIALLIMFT